MFLFRNFFNLAFEIVMKQRQFPLKRVPAILTLLTLLFIGSINHLHPESNIQNLYIFNHPELILTKKLDLNASNNKQAKNSQLSTEVAIPCMPNTSALHFTFTPDKGSYLENEQVSVTCDSGYRPEPNVTDLTCLKNGTWAPRWPYCIEIS